MIITIWANDSRPEEKYDVFEEKPVCAGFAELGHASFIQLKEVPFDIGMIAGIAEPFQQTEQKRWRLELLHNRLFKSEDQFRQSAPQLVPGIAGIFNCFFSVGSDLEKKFRPASAAFI
jgi:hypothetical protein